MRIDIPGHFTSYQCFQNTHRFKTWQQAVNGWQLSETGALETVFLDWAVLENNAHVVGRRKLAAAPNRSCSWSDRLRIKACNTKTLSEDSTKAILVKEERRGRRRKKKKCVQTDTTIKMTLVGKNMPIGLNWTGNPPTDKTGRKTDKGKEPMALDWRRKKTIWENSSEIKTVRKNSAKAMSEAKRR